MPVPVSKLSYDSIMLGFAIETGCEALLPRTAFLARFSFCRWKRRSQNGAASLWNPAAESVAVWRMPEKDSLERCDSSAEPALVFRTIKATRLGVANYNTTLSSESLETGTGASNSLRSANESGQVSCNNETERTATTTETPRKSGIAQASRSAKWLGRARHDEE